MRPLLLLCIGLAAALGTASAAMPELIADYSLNEKRESEKIGLKFHAATGCAGAVKGGVFVNRGGYIRIPVCPTIRARGLMPEINLDYRQGSIGFWYAPVSVGGARGRVMFYYGPTGRGAQGRSSLSLFREGGRLCFRAVDMTGKTIAAAAPVVWKPGELSYVSARWQMTENDRPSHVGLYVNGKRLAEAGAKLGRFGPAPVDFYVGSVGGANAAVGTYDEIKVWSVAKERFEVTRDSPRDVMAAAKPIYVENFEGKNIPDSATRKTLLGRSFDMSRPPLTLKKGALTHPVQGMLEFLYQPAGSGSDRELLVSASGKTGTVVSIARRGAMVEAECFGVRLRGRAPFKKGRWTPIAVLWNAMTGKAVLYAADRAIGRAEMPGPRQTLVGDRVTVGAEGGTGLIDGLKIWTIAAADKIQGRQGVLLTGNARYGVNTKSLNIFGTDLRELEVHAFTGGEYRVVPPPTGKKDVRPGGGPFTFAEGRLTDGVDDNPGERYRISTGHVTDLIVDLKKAYPVTRIELCAMNRWNWVTETAVFYVSMGGETWRKVGASRDKTPGYTRQTRFIHKSPGFVHKARYVKITATPRPKHYASFAEINVYGVIW